MTDQELRELDAYLAEHVFGFKRLTLAEVDGGAAMTDKTYVAEWVNLTRSLPRYTTNPAVAMLVLEKCAIRTEVKIRHDGSQWQIFGSNSRKPVSSPTLPMVICLFAKDLFK